MQYVNQGATTGRYSNVAWIFELRGFLALYVLFHHATLNIDDSGTHDSLWNILHNLLGTGQFRVDIFFVLSGYCLALSLKGAQSIENFKEFLLRRSMRLLPPYFVACAFSLIAVYFWIGDPSGTHWDVSLPVSTGAVITHMLLIHNWWRQYAASISHPFWSVAVEFQLYFLFPLLIQADNKLGNWKSWVLITAIAYGAWHVISVLDIANPTAYGSSFYYAALFSMGIAAARIHARQNTRSLPQGWDLVMALGMISLMSAWWFIEWSKYGHVADQIESFFTGLATFCIFAFAPHSQPSKAAPRGWRHKLLTYLGKRSYSMYLLHAPLLQMCWVYFVQRLHLRSSGKQVLLEILAGSALTFLATEIYYRAIERPFHDLSRHVRWPQRPLQLTLGGGAR